VDVEDGGERDLTVIRTQPREAQCALRNWRSMNKSIDEIFGAIMNVDWVVMDNMDG
jgi:hypothetical protein